MGEGRERLGDTAKREKVCFHVCHFHHYNTSSQFMICLLVYKSITVSARRRWTETRTLELTALTISLLQPFWVVSQMVSKTHTKWSSLWCKVVVVTMSRRFYSASRDRLFHSVSGFQVDCQTNFAF